MATLTSSPLRATATANFDALAPVYRWMEWLSFGPCLGKCRNAFLESLRGAKSALVLGDGDGRFSARLLRDVPEVRVQAVDLSAAMLRSLVTRAGKNAGRVHTWNGDAREWRAGGARYDVIATHFFLDCLTTSEIVELASQLRLAAGPGTRWVVSEFAVPPSLLGRWIARPLIAFLYWAFFWLTGLEVRALPDYAVALQSAGFSLEQRRRFLGGLLVAEMWRL